ncbi:hypothetical protein CK203_090491 [Vitis vinifera]|uniref:Uncharacterized protein n=1 Tax=Vitis vinifera TaxID=29760 RepID=A0A438BTW1_VITVI|nr:hypothetical protein CK203_090491 [Vitis vinifera]
MSAKKDAASSSAAGQSDKDASGEVHAEKSVDKLNMREFYESFCIPNGVSVQLVDREAVSIEKSADNAIYFTKKQFNAGAPVPSPVVVQRISSLHPDPSGLHSSEHSPGADGPGCPPAFLQLVTHLPDSTKAGANGHVLVLGVWVGLLVCPNRSLVLPSTDKRGRIVKWVKKASFDRLNKLFEIAASERHHQTLLTARNLLAIVRKPKAYIINILPRKLPKKIVLGEHFVVKNLSFYTEARKADA